MRKFFEIQYPFHMPDADYGVWGAKAGINPPGGLVGAIIASSATISPTKPIHHVSGTTSITTVVPPFAGFVGELTLIADGAWTMTTGGTAGSAIGTSITAIAGKAISLVYDGATWYPRN